MKKVNALRFRIRKLQNEITEIQSVCLHQLVQKERKSGTGNYDPSCDAYWVNYHCLDCDKKWSAEKIK